MIDTGSWELISRRQPPYPEPGSKAIECWCGLAADMDKVPKTGCTGSTAYCVDTGDRYMFEETTDSWYPQSFLIKDGPGSAVSVTRTENEAGGVTVMIVGEQ